MKRSWDIISTSSNFEVTLEGDFVQTDESKERRTKYLWEKAAKKRPDSFVNGYICSFVSASIEGNVTKVKVRRVRYMYYYTQHIDPKLNYQITPVGVSGVLEVPKDDGRAMIVAKRGNNVTQYSGYYEFVPSGGIDENYMAESGRIDFTGQLRTELKEETGLDESCVEEIKPIAFIKDIEGGVYDLCAVIKIKNDITSDMAGLMRSDEYCDFIAIKYEELDSFLKDKRGRFVPTSLAIANVLSKSQR